MPYFRAERRPQRIVFPSAAASLSLLWGRPRRAQLLPPCLLSSARLLVACNHKTTDITAFKLQKPAIRVCMQQPPTFEMTESIDARALAAGLQSPATAGPTEETGTETGVGEVTWYP